MVQQQVRGRRGARVDRGVQHREARGAAQLRIRAPAQQEPLS